MPSGRFVNVASGVQYAGKAMEVTTKHTGNVETPLTMTNSNSRRMRVGY
jgi:hypothetical protein